MGVYFWDTWDLEVFLRSRRSQLLLSIFLKFRYSEFFEIRADFLRSTNILRSQSIFWDLWDPKVFFEIFEIPKHFWDLWDPKVFFEIQKYFLRSHRSNQLLSFFLQFRDPEFLRSKSFLRSEKITNEAKQMQFSGTRQLITQWHVRTLNTTSKYELLLWRLPRISRVHL